ncbi:MAG: hypothetical protein ACRESR_09985 [Gammaproteobacteria bacterium]
MKYFWAVGIFSAVVLGPWAIPVAHASPLGWISAALPTPRIDTPWAGPAQDFQFSGMSPSYSRLSQRIKIAWPGENENIWHTPILLPTMDPTAPPPLVFDLTPLMPCPPGEYRRWYSFGEMPAVALVAAAWAGYPQSSLCALMPAFYLNFHRRRIIFHGQLNHEFKRFGELASHRKQTLSVSVKRSYPKLGFRARRLRNRCLASKGCEGMNSRLQLSDTHPALHGTSPSSRPTPHSELRYPDSDQGFHFRRRTAPYNRFSRQRYIARPAIRGRRVPALLGKRAHPGMHTGNGQSPSGKSKPNVNGSRARHRPARPNKRP